MFMTAFSILNMMVFFVHAHLRTGEEEFESVTMKTNLVQHEVRSEQGTSGFAHDAESTNRTKAKFAESSECKATLPEGGDPQYYEKLREEVLCGCGEVCTFKDGIPGKYFNSVAKDVKCDELFSNRVMDQSSNVYPPPTEIPSVLKADFTLDGRIPIKPKYIKDEAGVHSPNADQVWTKELISRSLEELKSGKLAGTYGAEAVNSVHELFLRNKNRIAGKHCAVVGSQKPWVEVAFLSAGAAKITTIEYSPIKSDDERIVAITPDQWFQSYANENSRFDCVASYSSIEHSGLGRYGDVINPFGDLQTMAQLLCTTKAQAPFFIGVPVGDDTLYWEAHRQYGPLRLPQLFANIAVDDASSVVSGQQMFVGVKS